MNIQINPRTRFLFDFSSNNPFIGEFQFQLFGRLYYETIKFLYQHFSVIHIQYYILINNNQTSGPFIKLLEVFQPK